MEALTPVVEQDAELVPKGIKLQHPEWLGDIK